MSSAPENHHAPHAVPHDRRTRRGRSPLPSASSPAAIAGFVIAAAVIAVVGLVAFRNLSGGGSDLRSGKSMYDAAMNLAARNPEAAILELRAIPSSAGEWYDEGQRQIRALEARLGRGPSTLTEEEAWDRLYDMVRTRTKPDQAGDIILECASFVAAFPGSDRRSEVDGFAEKAQRTKADARTAAVDGAEKEIGALLRAARYDMAVRKVNDLLERHRHDFDLRRLFESRHREIVEAGLRHFDERDREAAAIMEQDPVRAQRIYSGLITSLGDGKVDEFSSCCRLAARRYEQLNP